MPEHPDTTPPAELLPPAAALAALARLLEDVSGRLTAPAPLLWTREDLAAALNISVRTLGELEASGVIGPEPIRIGGSGRLVRYDADRVRAWVAAGLPSRQRWVAIEAATKTTRRAG